MLTTEYDGCGRCMVGVRRLSRKSDATSSPERQGQQILGAVAGIGGHVIAWADDWEVSGATNPLDRKGFGPWLRGELGPYDGIASASVDRVGRNVRDTLNTQELLTGQGRIVVTADHAGVWDFGDPNQENEWMIKAWGSQMELRAIQKRNRDETLRARTGRACGAPGGPAATRRPPRDRTSNPRPPPAQHPRTRSESRAPHEDRSRTASPGRPPGPRPPPHTPSPRQDDQAEPTGRPPRPPHQPEPQPGHEGPRPRGPGERGKGSHGRGSAVPTDSGRVAVGTAAPVPASLDRGGDRYGSHAGAALARKRQPSGRTQPSGPGSSGRAAAEREWRAQSARAAASPGATVPTR